MSQSYVIRVSASVSETVDAADKRTKSLQLTEIVPCDEQAEIIRNELRDRGWEEVEGSEGQVWEKTDGKVRQRIDLDLSLIHI